jgi:Uma2 family endonuclease
MAFVVDDKFLPATLTAHPMTDDEFTEFCAEYPDLFFEMTAEGDLIVMPPAYSLNGARNAVIGAELGIWSEKDGLGVGCASSAGFVLPNGARRSADASWTLKSRIAKLDPASREKFWRLSPDFVIELQSSTDRPRLVREKMEEWMANGAQLAWLIDPDRRSVTIYRPDREVETLADIDSIAGEGPVAGFVLDLSFVWNPLGN